MKIDKTQPFSVDRGTEEQIKKTWNIIKENGIPFLTDFKDFNAFIHHYTFAKTFRYLNNGFFMLGTEVGINYYTPEEFHVKYGKKFDYPFELVGEVIEYCNKYLKEIDQKSQSMLVSGIDCYATEDGAPFLFHTKLYAITGSRLRFSTDAALFSRCFVVVDPPEPKTVTRPMTADEVVALGPIWVKSDSGSIFFGTYIQIIYANNEIRLFGQRISELEYADSSTATEWKKFEVAEVVK